MLRRYFKASTVFLLALTLALAGLRAGTQAPAAETRVAPGVTYRAMQTKSPDGEPWSIHVLRFNRKAAAAGGLALRAEAGRGFGGEMQRELPTAMGGRAGAVAVVNGDYDIAVPYLGISDGLAVASGELWTSAHLGRPVLGLRKSGEPVIDVPVVVAELSAGKFRWPIAAVNKPFGAAFGSGLRLYTREFRPEIKSDTPFRAAVIADFSPRLPLRVDSSVRGRVVSFVEETRELPIPRDGMVVALRLPAKEAPLTSVALAALAELRPGTKVKLRVRVTLGSTRGFRDVVGGFPILVREGQREVVGTPSENLRRRHPRTAVCYNREEIIFAVVDGRQPQLSVGMTLEELGDLMVSLGCEVAMNTDGGGSSVMAIRDTNGAQPLDSARDKQSAPLRIVNSPSDGQERGRGNAWVIVPKR